MAEGLFFFSLNLSASRTGKRLSRAVSLGSLNQDLMGIALSAEAELERGTFARHGQLDINQAYQDMPCTLPESYPK